MEFSQTCFKYLDVELIVLVLHIIISMKDRYKSDSIYLEVHMCQAMNMYRLQWGINPASVLSITFN